MPRTPTSDVPALTCWPCSCSTRKPRRSGEAGASVMACRRTWRASVALALGLASLLVLAGHVGEGPHEAAERIGLRVFRRTVREHGIHEGATLGRIVVPPEIRGRLRRDRLDVEA